MKKAFWRQDWFSGLLISLLFLFFAQNSLNQGLERTAYDFGVKLSQHDPRDQSLENLDRWPWPGDILADMSDNLTSAGARVISNTILMSEAQTAAESIQNLITHK